MQADKNPYLKIWMSKHAGDVLLAVTCRPLAPDLDKGQQRFIPRRKQEISKYNRASSILHVQYMC